MILACCMIYRGHGHTQAKIIQIREEAACRPQGLWLLSDVNVFGGLFLC